MPPILVLFRLSLWADGVSGGLGDRMREPTRTEQGYKGGEKT